MSLSKGEFYHGKQAADKYVGTGYVTIKNYNLYV
jgi:hypothetical protein